MIVEADLEVDLADGTEVADLGAAAIHALAVAVEIRRKAHLHHEMVDQMEIDGEKWITATGVIAVKHENDLGKLKITYFNNLSILKHFSNFKHTLKKLYLPWSFSRSSPKQHTRILNISKNKIIREGNVGSLLRKKN